MTNTPDPAGASGSMPDDLDMAQTLRSGGQPMLAGRYRIVRELGHGGMGSVYLAEDSKLDDRLVAIKMPSAILSQNKRAIKDLKREATTSMKLSHPSIVTLRSFEESDPASGGGVFLVMDYVDGQTLDDLLAEKEKLSEAEAAKLLTPIAEALDYAHGRGVVHRDVKPSNILIGQGGRATITDFGIARTMKDTMTRVTGRQDTSGTLPYMSPQQLMGDPPKPSQDVYSFGALLYECLCGHAPFFQGQIEAQIQGRDATDLDIVCGANGPLARQVMKALSKSPDDRPGSCLSIVGAASSGPSPAGASAGAAAGQPSGKAPAAPRQAPRRIVEKNAKAKPPPIAAAPPRRTPPPRQPQPTPPLQRQPAPHPGPPPGQRRPMPRKSGGAGALIFGIISLLFPMLAIITGPIAMILAGQTQAAVRRGEVDPSSLGIAKAGKVCGCLGFLLGLVCVAFIVLMIYLAVLEADQPYDDYPEYNPNYDPYQVDPTW